jgi:uncharacterized protein (DUF2147 family)
MISGKIERCFKLRDEWNLNTMPKIREICPADSQLYGHAGSPKSHRFSSVLWFEHALTAPVRGRNQVRVRQLCAARPRQLEGKPMKIRSVAMLATVLACGSLASAFAAEPIGNWNTEDGKAVIRIANCGGALCGTIFSLKEPNDPDTGRPKTDKNNADASLRTRPMIGVQIVLGMKPTGAANKWSGQVYNAEDGKIYSGNLTLQDANTIKLEGCILGGLICKASTWTRA